MKTILKSSVLCLGLLLGACATQPTQTASLGTDNSGSLTTAANSALGETAFVFAQQGRLAGRPGEAARAIAQAEFLAVDFSTNQRWTRVSPLVAVNLQAARREWRMALGIAESVPPQAVIDALLDAHMGLTNNDRGRAAASLPASVFPAGSAATLTRLGALPALPLTARATAFAQAEASRMEGN